MGSFVTMARPDLDLDLDGDETQRQGKHKLLFWGWRPRAEVELQRRQLISKVRWQLWAADTTRFFERMVAQVVAKC